MALFKILKGDSSNLSKQDIREGYCYVTTDEHKMYIDTNDARFALNAQSASELHHEYSNDANGMSSSINVSNGTIYIDNDSDQFSIVSIHNSKNSSYIDVCGNTLHISDSASDSSLSPSRLSIAVVEADGDYKEASYAADHLNYNDNILIDYEDAFFNGTAEKANTYANGAVGDEATPIYINEDGVPTPCEGLSVDGFLPLTAGPDKKLTGALGLTQDVMYGTELPNTGFDGQLFFLEDAGTGLPEGGTKGQIIMKNSNDNGDASWTNGYATETQAGLVSTGAQTFAGHKTFNGEVISLKGNGYGQFRAIGGNYGFMIRNDGSSTYFLLTNSGDASGTWNDLRPMRIDNDTGIVTCGTKLYGAVWNDYAEFRGQKETIEPGYCVASADDGQVYRTTDKLQACDGIVSDTFGFAIGETDECKTPLAVAGRVLAYCEGDRHSYHSGDTVCAGPEGRVCKMTREEIREWPDRIIGIVSEIPEYETWGSGNIPVNGRIWIKVK